MKTVLFHLFLIFSGSMLNAQSFTDRLTLQIGAAGNAPNNREPGTLSFTFQPSVRINKTLSVALRHDTHLIQFGQKGPKSYRTATSSLNYLIRDSYLKGLSSFVLIPQLHTNIFNTNFLFGCGFGYFNRKEIFVKIYSLDNRFLFGEYYPPAESLGYMFTSSVNFEKFNIGIIWTYIKSIELLRSTNGMASVFLNYSFIGNKNLFQEKEEEPSGLPVFMIGFGIQPLSNLGKYASALNIYIEPEIRIGNRLTMGFRVNSSHSIGVGYDDTDPAYYFENGLNWHKTKIMANVYSRLGTFNYYFQKNKGWYFINAGMGEYIRNKIDGVEAFDENGQVLVIPPLPQQKGKGGFIGSGFKTGIFRLSLEYNFTGKNIPDYLAAQMGLEVNFFQN